MPRRDGCSTDGRQLALGLLERGLYNGRRGRVAPDSTPTRATTQHGIDIPPMARRRDLQPVAWQSCASGGIA
eukprot:11182356-Lingulodinium_polyedra.AAC.1